MLYSTIYFPRQSITFKEFVPNKWPLIQILINKIIILLILFTLPEILNQDLLSWIMMILFAIEFWISKNVARKLINISWNIDSTSGEDIWIFEASLSQPKKQYQILFWYSFLFYGILLIVMGGLSLYLKKYSLLCAIVFGFGCDLVNFWAFSKIIKLRNSGKLQKLVEQATGEKYMQYTVKLPLNLKRTNVNEQEKKQRYNN